MNEYVSKKIGSFPLKLNVSVLSLLTRLSEVNPRHNIIGDEDDFGLPFVCFCSATVLTVCEEEKGVCGAGRSVANRG